MCPNKEHTLTHTHFSFRVTFVMKLSQIKYRAQTPRGTPIADSNIRGTFLELCQRTLNILENFKSDDFDFDQGGPLCTTATCLALNRFSKKESGPTTAEWAKEHDGDTVYWTEYGRAAMILMTEKKELFDQTKFFANASKEVKWMDHLHKGSSGEIEVQFEDTVHGALFIKFAKLFPGYRTTQAYVEEVSGMVGLGFYSPEDHPLTEKLEDNVITNLIPSSLPPPRTFSMPLDDRALELYLLGADFPKADKLARLFPKEKFNAIMSKWYKTVPDNDHKKIVQAAFQKLDASAPAALP